MSDEIQSATIQLPCPVCGKEDAIVVEVDADIEDEETKQRDRSAIRKTGPSDEDIDAAEAAMPDPWAFVEEMRVECGCTLTEEQREGVEEQAIRAFYELTEPLGPQGTND